MNQLIRLGIEAGPLLVFFIANARLGIKMGTACFMAATVVSLLLSWHRERKLPIMPIVGCAFVTVFGGLTLWLDNDIFIKIKPTVVNLSFAAVLFGGAVLRRNLLKPLLGTMLVLDETGWRILGVRWAGFFLILAVANEVVWRSLSTDAWVDFKVFGIMPLTLLFSALQMPLILKHQIAPAE
ncbi:MAG: septation protein A [Azospirillaceae bacterium]|nr:septation protein A [Azospirillaceae bacterium]